MYAGGARKKTKKPKGAPRRKSAWSEVFALATRVRKELAKKHPDWTVAKAMSMAWKDERVIKAREEYNKKKSKKTGEGTRRRRIKRKPTRKGTRKGTRRRRS